MDDILEPVQDQIYGDPNKGNHLYMIIWERVANSGITYCYAKDEPDALERYGFNPKYVKHTILRINISSMPVTCGNAN